ncbi:unnamed protein product [Amoebophrya sp. A120]|nr:unnamed protein product [Amoebophrya sp. A120]|eukprot:GSA120T00026352001.1
MMWAVEVIFQIVGAGEPVTVSFSEMTEYSTYNALVVVHHL